MTAITTLQNPQSDLLTRQEFASLLRVCPRTVQRWEIQGIIKSITIGPRVRRYSSLELKRLLATESLGNSEMKSDQANALLKGGQR